MIYHIEQTCDEVLEERRVQAKKAEDERKAKIINDTDLPEDAQLVEWAT